MLHFDLLHFHSWACSRSCAHMLNLWLFVSIAGWLHTFITLFAPSSRLPHAAVSPPIPSSVDRTRASSRAPIPAVCAPLCLPLRFYWQRTQFFFTSKPAVWSAVYLIFIYLYRRSRISSPLPWQYYRCAAAVTPSRSVRLGCVLLRLFGVLLTFYSGPLFPRARYFRVVHFRFHSLVFHSSALDHTQHNWTQYTAICVDLCVCVCIMHTGTSANKRKHSKNRFSSAYNSFSSLFSSSALVVYFFVASSFASFCCCSFSVLSYVFSVLFVSFLLISNPLRLSPTDSRPVRSPTKSCSLSVRLKWQFAVVALE